MASSIKPHYRLRCTATPSGALLWWCEVTMARHRYSTRIFTTPRLAISAAHTIALGENLMRDLFQ